MRGLTQWLDWPTISGLTAILAVCVALRSMRMSYLGLRTGATAVELSATDTQVLLLREAHTAQLALSQEQVRACKAEIDRLHERLTMQRDEVTQLRNGQIALLLELERSRHT